MKRHIRATPISVEDYLATQQTYTQLCFAKSTWTFEYFGNRGKDIIAETTQPSKYKKTDHLGERKQSSNKQRDMQGLNI